MTIESKYNIGDMVVAVPPRRKKESACEIIGLSVSSNREWYADENRVETVIYYTLKFKSGLNEWEIFKAVEDKVHGKQR